MRQLDFKVVHNHINHDHRVQGLWRINLSSLQQTKCLMMDSVTACKLNPVKTSEGIV